jgi:UDP-N-acetylglucosamine acyltransferase
VSDATIDSTARIADGAVIGEGAAIGPFCVIGPEVTIGPGCRLLGHVHIAGRTQLDANCTVHPFASLGGPPQIVGVQAATTELQIGEGCTIRESVTMNAGSARGGGVTRVGKRGYFMNCAHVGHDCTVGDDVIFATSATLGGHCVIGDAVFIGGLSAVHQHTRIGQGVMIGGVCGVRGDVIPYGLANGQYATLEGLNVVGMKRRGFTKSRLALVRNFYRELFHGPGTFAERLSAATPRASDDPAIGEILAFIQAGAHRALCLPETSAAA